MDALELASRRFVLLRSEWPVALARRRLDSGAGATHAVVHRVDDPEHEYWYVFVVDHARSMLNGAPDDATCRQALNLHEWGAQATVDAATHAAEVPAQAVVLDEGRLVGVVDRVEEANGGEEARPPVRRGSRRGTRAGGRASDTGGPGAVEEPVERTLEADFPETISVGDFGYLMVSLEVGPGSGGGVAVSAAPGDSIEVLVQPRKGFELDDREHDALEVVAEGPSLPVRFKLKATEAGPGEIRVLAFQANEAIGVIVLRPVIEAAPERRLRGRSSTAARRTSRRATVSAPGAAAVDLAMVINQTHADGKTKYSILLNALDPALDFNFRAFGPFELTLDPTKFFADFFEEIDALPVDTPQERARAQAALERKGAYLSEQLLPGDLREKLWQVRDRISTVIIQSDEPWIPWELCRLVGKEAGRIVEDGFLCEKYAITRWRPSRQLVRPLTLRNLAVVVPSDSQLPKAPDELEFVRKLAGPKRKVTAIPATFEDVQDAFMRGEYDGLHFTGHGAAQNANPDRSGMILEGDIPLTPEDVSGTAANVGVPKPLVFINACQIGRGGMALTGIGGWANRFVEAGAGAFVGAYWSVFDEPAFRFAQEVYGNLVKGETIGVAVRDARLAIKADGDPTWLAYTVFADPLARVEA